MTENSLSNINKSWLGAIVLVGLLLRLMAAYLQPAFYDEGHTFNYTKCDPAAIVQEMRRDSHPPTYNFLMYPLVHSTDSIFVLRLPCVLAGTGAILLGFFLGKRFGGERCGLLLATLLAISYNIWLLDAQLRSYGLLDCGLLALLLMVLNIYSDAHPLPHCSNPRWGWLGFTAIATLTASLHFTGCVTVACYALLLAILPQRQPLKQRALPLILLVASLLPALGWFIYVKVSAANFLSQAHALSINLREFTDIPAYLLGWNLFQYYSLDLAAYAQRAQASWSGVALFLAKHLNELYALAALLGWGLLIWGLGLAFQRDRGEACLAIAPPLALAFILIVSNMNGVQVLQKRHLLPLCPTLLMFICLLITSISSAAKRRTLTALIIGGCTVTALMFPWNTKLWNQHWQGALDFIRSQQTGHDVVLVYHGGAFYSFAMAAAPGQIRFDPHTGRVKASPEYDGPALIPWAKNYACPEFIEDIRNYRVFIVLNQYAIENSKDHLLDWLYQYYEPIASYHEDSYTDWAVVDVQTLQRKDI